MDQEIKEEMFKKALDAQKNAYVPYSDFPLGAAVLTEDGSIYTGVNIENASFSLTNCAERSAVFTAISAGKRKIKALLIVSSTDKPVPPCGACRQVIKEFADGDIEVIMMTESGKELTMTSTELLPGAFTDDDMEKNNEL
ncbi:MAG: cytidine deaminase [Halanaerobium sp. 4-GBenrich]|jgi:cytidine deaminase|uniref:Cytidine deaminase n=1 Tax=Halanaerobium congolense TaxID=54121 RepID=A0A1M7ML13_9FIRM|nr:cytidine deaminase [Halanaerobium congolense]KXS50539.1 MAG: cytidine deaminase [Halanaerobium sp. T82-1]ODS50720.1 MAG: cytidine deaminase [Halanaerobium sp. 4-GBenrich]OEG62639.1 MAG: cytidine deaminase [Halanaerobium sp. MDAL1]PTX16790.1 cytidine deaminase [Halanaerobium congolense]PXV66403.1 cytidine deaminase [Halanaerobium congolense]